MKLWELRDKCDELIMEGFENTEVYFDTEAMCFDAHIVKIIDLNIIKEDIIDENSYAILSFDFVNALIHKNI